MMETFVPKVEYCSGAQWQLCHEQPFAPKRVFQWSAINDLPDPTAVRVVEGGYMLRAPWRLKSRAWL
jgi:hypothetical protein